MKQVPSFVMWGSLIGCADQTIFYDLKQSLQAWLSWSHLVVQEFGVLHCTIDHLVFYHYLWGNAFTWLFMSMISSLQVMIEMTFKNLSSTTSLERRSH